MKVSIIIPIYNVSNFIGDCLDSVYKQDYNNIEVVLVNDCTPDDSMEIAKLFIHKLQEKFEVVIVEHESNKGLSASRNTGVNASSGDWIYFLDSDDEITSKCIRLLTQNVIKYPDSSFVIGGIQVVNGAPGQVYPLKIAEYQNNKIDIVNSYLQFKWYAMAWNKLINRNFFVENTLWFEDGLLHEDELFSYKLAFVSQAISVVYEQTYLYKIRQNESITTHRKQKSFNDLLFVYNYILRHVKDNQKYCKSLDYSNYIYVHMFNYIHSVLINGNLSNMEKRSFIGLAQKIVRKSKKHFTKLPLARRLKLYMLIITPSSIIVIMFMIKNNYR